MSIDLSQLSPNNNLMHTSTSNIPILLENQNPFQDISEIQQASSTSTLTSFNSSLLTTTNQIKKKNQPIDSFEQFENDIFNEIDNQHSNIPTDLSSQPIKSSPIIITNTPSNNICNKSLDKE